MFNKEQVQVAIKEIDANLALLNGPRQVHLALTSDVKLVQAVCIAYFEEREEVTEGKKDERANKPIIDTKPGRKDK